MNNENEEATEAALFETTRSGYTEQQEWGKAGFSLPLPESFAALLTKNFADRVIADARWRVGVKLQGDIEITEIKALTVGGNSAVVQVTANDDNVTFTVDGQPRNKLKNDTRTSKVELVYDTTWKIDQITEIEAS